jgi:serine protease
VAVTAGCAALWLSRHNVDVVRAKAIAQHTNVQELFRSALRQTARRPADWPASMGAGVVDAEALLALDLDAIVVTPKPGTGHPLFSELGEAFDWHRFGAEAGFLALDRSQRGDPNRNDALESPIAPRPSSPLLAAVRAVGRDPDVVFGAPAILTSPLTPEMSPSRVLRILATSAPGPARSTESTSTITENAARSYLEGAGRKDVLDQVEKTLGAQDPTKDADHSVTELRKSIIEATPAVLDQLAKGARLQDLGFAPEALIMMTGRPALRVQDGQIDPADPQIGDWGADLIPTGIRKILKPLIDAVGRIDRLLGDHNAHVGTGTVIPAPPGKTAFILTAPVSIAFDEAATDATRRFEITGVLAAGPVRIGQQADIGKLDMALLVMKETNDAGTHAPQPVKVTDLKELALPRVLVVGYPARPNFRRRDRSQNRQSVGRDVGSALGVIPH